MGGHQKKIRAITVGLLCGAVFFSGPAHAYVLTGPHLLELLTAAYGKARRLLVSQKLILFTADAQTVPTELRETVRYVFPESFRSDIQSPTAQRIHVSTRHEALTAIDGKIVNAPETEFDCYKDLLLYRSRETLQERLNWLGVNVTLTSLGRFQGEVAFVVGAQYPDESISQVWVEKETFRPLRWLMIKKTPSGQQTVSEIRYQNWQLFEGNWYPRQITFSENGRLVREIRVEGVQVNTAFAGDLFNISMLKKRYPPAAAATPEPQGSGGIGEIKKTIEEFKRMYE